MDTSFANASARKKILLLSGTAEGPILASRLADIGFAVRATVTREEACHNLFGRPCDNVVVEARGFTSESLAMFLESKEADLVLDATHPFAVRITRIAHEVCRSVGVPYVRYERPDWPPPPGTHLVDRFAEAATTLPTLGKRAMLTIGAKQLKHFAHLHDRLTMIARILPSPLSLEQAQKAGFDHSKVIPLRPPISLAVNKALFRAHRADVLVTKASGSEGGVVEKVTAARELGMAVLMIRRPQLDDVANVGTLEQAIAECRRHLS